MKSRPPTLAIVHDDGEVARLLAHALRERGVRVLTAMSIRDALTLFRLSRPDLVLTGIVECEAAPDQLGQLRSRSPGKLPVPILVLVRPGSDDRRRALRMGLTQHLPVPCEDHELLLTVGSFLPLSSERLPVWAPASPSGALGTRPVPPASLPQNGSASKEQDLEDLFGSEVTADEPVTATEDNRTWEALAEALAAFETLAEETRSFLAPGELAEVLEEVRAELFESLPMISLVEIEGDGCLSVLPGADRVLATMPADTLKAALGTWNQCVLVELERRHPGRFGPQTPPAHGSEVTPDSPLLHGPRS
ncbi:MAG TPA: hypothetical protein VF017_13420 [Thermoanaerobaculia bacterium]|nr:hypothetical protein [Thermoanaerobaculia bacterium]